MNLLDYAELEGSELGEYCKLLCELDRYGYAASPEFTRALDAEIKAQLDYFKDNTTVLSVRLVPEAYLVEKLKWND